MDLFRSRPTKARAAHCQAEANKFRKMAEAELVESIREQLFSVARQYQELADSLLQSN